MRVLELEGQQGLLKDWIRIRDQQDARPEGLHQSAIVSDIVKRLKLGKITDEGDGETRETYCALGLAWEWLVKQALMARGIRGETPAPRRHDGIWVTPDWRRTRTGAIDEMKLTWVSSREGIGNPKLLKYKFQLLTYMHVWESEIGYLHVGFVNGTWRPPVPEYRCYQVRASALERRENWDFLKRHAREAWPELT